MHRYSLYAALVVIFVSLMLGGVGSAFALGGIVLSGVISVVKTEHLDTERQFVSDIKKITDLDGIWSETIPDLHYVRVTFERNLNSNNDITIYPRIISGDPRIEVYEKDGTKPIGEFVSIKSNQYNKVFLDNLQESQNTFDLLILGGSVEFDHVVDPWPVPTYVGVGTSTASATAITPPLPSGLQTNDILILFVETANQQISISNQNGGTWTEITNSPQGTGTAGAASATRLTAFWSRYNGVQGAPTTSDSGDHQLGRIVAFRGVITSGNPWDVTSGNVDATSDTSLSANGATTTIGNTLVVISAALDDDADNFGATWTNSNLASITSRSNTATKQGNDGRLGIVTGQKATVSTYGATTNTLGSASTKGMMTIALRPPLPVAPTLSVSQPDGASDTILSGSSYSITYTLYDPDDVVTTAFYYDTNNSGLDGTAISGACATAAEGSGAVCSWDTTGVSAGIYYVYGVTNDGTNPAVNAYSLGQITINTLPSIPTELIATAISDTQVNLSWSAPLSDGGSSITGYKIERESPVGGGWSTLIADTGSTATTYSDTGLIPNTQYNYQVSAITAVGTGNPSNTASSTTNTSVPSAPTGLAAIAASDTQINLSWTAPASNGGSPITGYKIERESPIGGGWSVLVPDTGSTSISYSDTGLTSNTQYNYRVSAINVIGTGSPSSAASATTAVTMSVPSPPLSLVGMINETQVDLSWSAPLSDGNSTITDYVIEYSSDGSAWVVFADGVSTQTSASISGLSSEFHLFRVFAVNAIGTSSASNIADVTSSESTSVIAERNPPTIIGLGVYHFEFPESFVHSHGINETSRFENYYPYAINTYTTDPELYQPLGNYEKTGTFFKLEDDLASSLSQIHTEPNDYFQFQIQILDEYRGSKIEHVVLYFVDPNSNNIKSDTAIIWEKPDAVKILDPNHIIDSVHVTTSLEDGYFWAVFDVKIRESIDSDIGIEASHESGAPTFAKVTNLLQKLTSSEFIERKNIIDHVARIIIPNEHTSSPDCNDTNSCFIPYDAYVLKDGMVIWANEDEDFIHSITSGSPETGPDNKFNGLVHPGEIYHHNFGAIGIYPYYCMIHPWAKGLITVVEETTAVTVDQLHSPGVNVAGDVAIPKKSEFPIILETDLSGKSILIKPNDKIVLENKKLDVKISGYVGIKNPVGPVEINIIRPDGSASKYSIPVNEDGKYYLPTKLGNEWKTGTFQIIAKYNGKEIGNISFIVADRQKGFGGILKTSDGSLDVLDALSTSADKNSLSGIGWLSVETQDPEKPRLYLLTKVNPDAVLPTTVKFEYYYLLGVVPVIVAVLLFKNKPKPS